jgi:uncharacterized membrane protein YkoI
MSARCQLEPAIWRRMTQHHWIAFLSIAVLALAPVAASGQQRPKDKDHDAALEALRRGEVLPLTRILPIVQKRVPGDVIKIKLDEDNDTGRINYSVKVLTSAGRIIEVEVDAKTGIISEVEEE